MGEASRKADDAMFRDPVLLELMTELRATAVNLKIDMTDAFSEFVPHGPEGALGIMPKNRFRAALGTIFKGAKLSDAQLKQVSIAYGTGDPDPREPGTRNRVLYKQFAIDFDEILPPAPAVVGALDEAMLAELRMLKRAADNKRLDMTDAFAEFAPPGKDSNLGVMPKNRFRSAMGVLFQADTHIQRVPLVSLIPPSHARRAAHSPTRRCSGYARPTPSARPTSTRRARAHRSSGRSLPSTSTSCARRPTPNPR